MIWSDMIMGAGLGTVIGVMIGFAGVKLYQYVSEKKIKSNAEKFLNGERENKIDINGVIMDVHDFRVLDDAGENVVLQFGGHIRPKELNEVKVE